METTEQPAQRAGTLSDSGPSQPQSNKVVVTGFPGGLPARRLLGLFPGSRIETLGWKHATLRFPTPAEAQAALRARVTVDGAQLRVKYERPHKGRKDNRRPRPPEKKLDPALDPRAIDLSGDFHAQLDAVLVHVRLNQEEVARVSLLFNDLESALQDCWPGCTAQPFGSITSGLGVKGSDADCLVLLPRDEHADPTAAAADAVLQAYRKLKKHPAIFREVIAIPGAHTPIVKFVHTVTGTRADVSFKSSLGVRNSRLLAFLLHADARVLPAAVCLKYWARVAGFTGSGRLTNYALTLMLVFYLQTEARLLPPVCRLQNEATAYIVDGWDTGFDARYEVLPSSTCDASIADLIGGFFRFYAAFDFKRDVVNPFLGRVVERSLFDDPHNLPPEYDLYRRNLAEGRANPIRTGTPVCVQDPFEHSHNVASMVSAACAETIMAFVAFAATAYERERERDCVSFLGKILLEKPDTLVRPRVRCEYRVVMKHPHLARLHGDWRQHVRDAALRAFQDMLKLSLTRLDEKNTDGGEQGKKKERYLGVLVKPVWRRKSGSKKFHFGKCSFVERQALITEEILATDPSRFDVPFRLEIQASENSGRRATVSIRPVGEVVDAGKAQKYRDFGQFFLAVVQGWMYQLLDRHALPLRDQYVPREQKESVQSPDDSDERSTDDECETSGPIVIHNSSYSTNRVEAMVADITESVKTSL